jgi:hypothetical protein
MEYLCTLQPPIDSALSEDFKRLREECSSVFGLDGTGLYPPHVSVTGFFFATPEQASAICEDASMMIATAKPSSLIVEVREALATDRGHALLDISAPGVAQFAVALATVAKDSGVEVRPKAVSHLSLAAGRSREQCDLIVQMYSNFFRGQCSLDLVIAKLMQRSDVTQLATSGEAHVFQELLRQRLPGPVEHPKSPISEIDVKVPVRQRSWDALFATDSTCEHYDISGRSGVAVTSHLCLL